MPIEIVCKIKFAEEDAKPKEKEAGDEQSLLGAARGAAGPRDLATFASTSTLHGLGRACAPGPHGLRRALWALALLTSLVAFLYQAVGLARGYLTWPHLVAMDPATPAPVAGFPAVTLCNINRFRHSALSDADIFHLANLTGLPPKDRDGHRAAGLRYPEPDMVDILNRTGHQLADMLKSCNFSGHHCSASNFSVVSSVSQAAWPGVARGWCVWVVREGILSRASLPSATRGGLVSRPAGASLWLPGPGAVDAPWGLPSAAPLLGPAAAAVPRAGLGASGGARGPGGCTIPRPDQPSPLCSCSPSLLGLLDSASHQGKVTRRGVRGALARERLRAVFWGAGPAAGFMDTGCQCLSVSVSLTPPHRHPHTSLFHAPLQPLPLASAPLCPLFSLVTLTPSSGSHTGIHSVCITHPWCWHTLLLGDTVSHTLPHTRTVSLSLHSRAHLHTHTPVHPESYSSLCP